MGRAGGQHDGSQQGPDRVPADLRRWPWPITCSPTLSQKLCKHLMFRYAEDPELLCPLPYRDTFQIRDRNSKFVTHKLKNQLYDGKNKADRFFRKSCFRWALTLQQQIDKTFDLIPADSRYSAMAKLGEEMQGNCVLIANPCGLFPPGPPGLNPKFCNR